MGDNSINVLIDCNSIGQQVPEKEKNATAKN